MGAKISKSIGFFVPSDKAELLFSDMLAEVIDDTFISSDIIQKMNVEFENFQKVIKNDHNFRFISSRFEIKALMHKDKVAVSEFLSSIYHFDENKGFLFKTPELNKYGKSDDLIDYYENVDNPVYKIQYLKTNIYPQIAYVCIKDKSFDTDEACELAHEYNGNTVIKKNSFISFSDLQNILVADGDKQAMSTRNFQHLVESVSAQDKHFHYCIDPLCYIFAKCTGIIPNYMSYYEFIQYAEPAIITTWN